MNLPPSCPSRELFERSLESTCRALAGDPGLRIGFSGQETSSGSKYFQLSWPDERLADQNQANRQIAAIRGMYDAIGMKFRYHDADLHHAMAPAGPLSRAVFDEFENLRIEAVASEAMSGVAENLAASFAHRCRLRGLDLLASDAATPLVNAIVLLLRTRLVATPLADTTARFIGRWQDEIMVRTANQTGRGLDGLCAAYRDQAEFARQSRYLIDSLELVEEPEHGPQAKPAETPPDGEEGESGFDQAGVESNRGEAEAHGNIGAGGLQSGEDDQQEPGGLEDCEPEAGASHSVIPFPHEGEREPGASSNLRRVWDAFTQRLEQFAEPFGLVGLRLVVDRPFTGLGHPNGFSDGGGAVCASLALYRVFHRVDMLALGLAALEVRAGAERLVAQCHHVIAFAGL